MGEIETIYEDLETEDVSLEEFRQAVTEKVEQMGGLADEETAAMLIAHDLTQGQVETIADIQAGMEEVRFVGKVISIGSIRTFERDGEAEEGHVLNVEVADETGGVRVALWDGQAVGAAETLERGEVLRVAGTPKDGYGGLEVSANRAEPDDSVTIDISVEGASTAEALTLGQSEVTLQGVVLETDEIRTFGRDDGTEGRVSNLTLGDETGRVRVTLWDEKADLAAKFDPGTSVEVIDGSVRERDGSLELHVGAQGAVEEIDASVEFAPATTPIAELELDTVADIAGVIRSADPKRTFEREDGSEGQVRNVRLQDQSDDIRVALWGDLADRGLGPGDELYLGAVEISDGWQEDLEASAGWRSTVVQLEGAATARSAETATQDQPPTDGQATLGASAGGRSTATEETASSSERAVAESTLTEFTGTVVQTGDPVVLDDGEQTCLVETSSGVELGQEVTVSGRLDGERIIAETIR
jgi:replication factor A1